ncbi:MAG: hypothetical protein V4475_09445 [Pseudomonadota bacterium]
MADLNADQASDSFEAALDCVLGSKIRASDDTAKQVWSALTNQEWQHEDGREVEYSFREAGDLIARIRGRGSYMEWYCASPAGVVSESVANALHLKGWTLKAWGGDPL